MTGFQEFSNSFGFIVFFLVGTLVFTMVFGDQVSFWFLLLVLLGQIFANVDKFESLIGRFNQ
ncbi:hypothetical protein D3C72_2398450 [compost metagenome]